MTDSMNAHPVGSARDLRPHSVRHRNASRWAPTGLRAAVTESIDLREFVDTDKWRVFQQGTLNSCTANALSAAIQYELLRHAPEKAFVPSRLFIWYQARVLENEVAHNEPVYLTDDVKGLQTAGVCAEEHEPFIPADSLWPYSLDTFTKKPADACFEFANAHRFFTAVHLDQDLDHLLARLRAGHTFTINVAMLVPMEPPACYGPDFPDYDDLGLPKDEKGIEAVANARPWHTMLVVGADLSRGRFLLRNSMGDGWGDGGYGTIPFQQVLTPALCDSLWSVELAR